MSSRSTQRTPTPTKHTKDPPSNGRTNYGRGQGRNVTWQSYASVAARNLVSPAKVVRSQQEQEARETTPNSTESASWTPQESHYRPIKRGSAEHSVFFDVTGSVTAPKLFYKALSGLLTEDQHLGAKFSKENGRSLIEIACDSDSTCDKLIESGVVVNDIKLIPTKAFAQDADIVTLMLSDLPFVRKLDLQKNLHEILGKYGDVLDVLLFTDPDSGFFFGNGMAILNRTAPKEIQTTEGYDPSIPHYDALTHNLDYYGKKRFHAKWRNMPPHCVYCHSEEHVVDKCDERPQIRCWNCSAIGHISAKCPQKNVMKSRKKPKHQHRADEFSESQDEAFDQQLITLGEKAEQEQQKRQNGTNSDQSHKDGSDEPTEDEDEEEEEEEKKKEEVNLKGDSSDSELSELEDEEMDKLGEDPEEDVEMEDNIVPNDPESPEQDVPMENTDASATGNNGQPTLIPVPTAKKGATPRTPKHQPQVTTHRYSLRSRGDARQAGSKKPANSPKKH